MKKKYFILILLITVIGIVLAFDLGFSDIKLEKLRIQNSKVQIKNIKPYVDTIKSTNFAVDSKGTLKKLFINNNTIDLEEYDISSGKFNIKKEKFSSLKKSIKNLDNYKLVKNIILDQNILDNKFPINKLVFAYTYNIIDEKSEEYMFPSIKMFSVIYILKLDGSLLNSFIIKDKIVNSVSLNQKSNEVIAQIFDKNSDENLISSIILYKSNGKDFREELNIRKKYSSIFFYKNSIFTVTKLNNPYSTYEVLTSSFDTVISQKIDTSKEMIWFDSIGVFKKNKTTNKYIFK